MEREPLGAEGQALVHLTWNTPLPDDMMLRAVATLPASQQRALLQEMERRSTEAEATVAQQLAAFPELTTALGLSGTLAGHRAFMARLREVVVGVGSG